MATVVNNTGQSDSAAGMGILIGLVVLLALGLLLWSVGLPALRRATQPGSTTIENRVNVPAQPESAANPVTNPGADNPGTSIEVPDQINVDVQGLPDQN